MDIVKLFFSKISSSNNNSLSYSINSKSLSIDIILISIFYNISYILYYIFILMIL